MNRYARYDEKKSTEAEGKFNNFMYPIHDFDLTAFPRSVKDLQSADTTNACMSVLYIDC